MNRFLLSVILSGILIACSSDPQKIAGGTSDSGNPEFSGIILLDSTPVAGAEVSLYPVDFNPVTDQVHDNMRDTTDNRGAYLLKAGQPARYNIQVHYPKDSSVALLKTADIFELKDTILEMPDVSLEEPETIIVGTQDILMEEDGTIYIPGTNLKTKINQTMLDEGVAVLTGIPPAVYPSLNYSSPIDTQTHVITEEPVDATTGNPLVVGWADTLWNQSTNISINTASSGAGITYDLFEFPLRVHLNSQNFDFNSVQTEGEDIRFYKPDGTGLPYEIEYWDKLNQQAEIWVLIDRIKGNDSTQYFTLNWGNTLVQSASNSAHVFSIHNGFSGVWHLGEPVVGQGGTFYDATSNANHLEGDFMIPRLNSQSVIGKGLNFNGMPNKLFGPMDSSLHIVTSVTLETWVLRADTGVEQEFITYDGPVKELEPNGDEEGNNHLYIFFIGLDNHLNLKWEYGAGIDQIFTSTDSLLSPIGDWVHIAAVRNSLNNEISFYENGTLLGDIVHYATPPTGGSFANLDIAVDCYTEIDEVRVSNIPRTTDWLKLSSFSQASNGRLLKFSRSF